MPSENERPKLSRRRKPKEKDVEAFVSGTPDAEEESRSRQPPEDTIRFNANLPEGLHKRLKIRSVEEGRSMTEIAIEAISTYLSDK